MGARVSDAAKSGRNMSVDSASAMPGLPADDCLRAGLESVLKDQGSLDGELVILDRQKNTYTSTFPSEIVTCQTGSGAVFRLFFKYSAERDNAAYGHRGGVGYEAKVYGQLLHDLGLSIANLCGSYRSPDGTNTWLILDYLDGGIRMTETTDPEAAMAKAARWMGQFQASCSSRVSNPALSFLTKYSPDYYRGWISRTRQLVKQAGVESGWLRAVCSRIDAVIEVLCESQPTIIHGEFYPKNVLLQDGLIYPVDWESAAIGNGLIDLATMTEGWSPEITREFMFEYQRSRWPDAAPRDFIKSLHAARIYVQFRWLGDQQACLPECACYLEALHEHAEEMGLI